MAGNDIILWSVPSDPDSDDVRLRDPNATAGGSTYTLTALGGSYSLTGASAVISRNRGLVAQGGAYTVNGAQAVLSRNRTLTASGGAYTYTGQQATITYTPGAIGYTLTAQGGSYTYTGQTATILKNRSLSATGGTYAYTGAAAIISRGRNLSAQGGAYALAGGDAVITKTSPGAYVLTALGGEYSITGGDAAIYITPAQQERRGGIARNISNRKWYEIEGKRYFLTEQELAVMVQALLQKYRLKEAKKAKVAESPKPETVSAQEWAKVEGLLIELEALTTPIIETTVIANVKKSVKRISDDELILLMM